VGGCGGGRRGRGLAGAGCVVSACGNSATDYEDYTDGPD